MSGDTVDAGAMAAQWRGTLVELLGIEFVELAGSGSSPRSPSAMSFGPSGARSTAGP